jgi:precorrin-6Y C5,15-methyltransferase (decarboxylating)
MGHSFYILLQEQGGKRSRKHEGKEMTEMTKNATISHPPPCRIIGVLDDGAASLSQEALAHLRAADLVIGVGRTLKLLEGEISPAAAQHDMSGNFSSLPGRIREAQERGARVVVLATGDPLCHGIAAFLQSRLCVEAFEILPNLSIMQIICARLGMPWREVKICSVHGRDAGEWREGAGPEHGLYPLLAAARNHDRLAIYTSPANGPARIARMLITEGMGDEFIMAVGEKLMQKGERIHSHMELAEAQRRDFANPNMVVLWRSSPRPSPVLFGLEEESFARRHDRPQGGLITKLEVRAVSLALMGLRRESIVWDIGAGSGAVGLEAARLCPDGFVCAIEKNPDCAAMARQNRRAMKISNYRLVHGKAPEGLEDWPDPDAVFIGGSGGELKRLIALCLKRLRKGGTLVMNFITLENLAAAMEEARKQGARHDVRQLQISRSKPILNMQRLEAQNPVWIMRAVRHED